MSQPKCCACYEGKCSNCKCARSHNPCTSCYPNRVGRCVNSSFPSPDPSTSRAAPLIVPSVSSQPSDSAAFDDIFRVYIPTLRHVPKATRNEWASLLASHLDEVCRDPQDLGAWTRLLCLPKWILPASPRGGKKHWREKEKEVRKNIHKAKANPGPPPALRQPTRKGQKANRRPVLASLDEENVRRATQAAREGQFRKACLALTSQGMAQDRDTLAKLQAKHPASPPPVLPSQPVPSPIVLSSEIVLRAINSFPSGTAPGPSGFRAAHIKDAVGCPSPDVRSKVLASITKCISLLLSGSTPSVVRPNLCGASLFACKKKTGGIRPIAVGEVWRRLASKCASRALQKDIVSVLSPLQVGVGVPGGAEAIVHAVSSLVGDGTSWILQVDFENAFNSIDRSSVLDEVRANLPSLSAWAETSYGSSSNLLFKDNVIHSSTGVQQGDPLGPLFFALALHPVVKAIEERVPSLNANAWYLDDGCICGPGDAVGEGVRDPSGTYSFAWSDSEPK